MQPWRRNFILFMGERPWRLMSILVAIGAGIGMWIGRGVWQGDPTPIVLPPERAWQQPIIDTLGSAGYVYLMAAFAGACFGVAVWLKFWLLARSRARWIREVEAAGYSV